MTEPSMLIVGAAEESLGEAVYRAASEDYGFAAVNTAGISGEQVKLDVTHPSAITEVLANVRPDILVCTVGVNEAAKVTDPYLPLRLTDAFRVNVVGVMELLRHFAVSPVRPERAEYIKKFVAVSSNSARIPRTGSMAYCASKAALSMALRVAAREMAGSPAVWGYEPGLLAGTPMTRATEEQFPDSALHRMKGVGEEGLEAKQVANRILSDVANYFPGYNGVMFPLDAGEL